ncbi:hypothetical protein Godav_002521 [Gossypium davidsonii]|uniref:Uncharacterized protein n=1 Tax=Gossypium davidsonii TaxID=34287 RepID=A0A7J8SWD4_GOSDV|nr:hypothetical protein [Gossypium davidsonii]
MEPVDREKQEVHEKVSETSREIANSISCYIRKLEIKEERVHSRSGSRIVVKNALGKVLASRSILHVDVGTIFTAEALACSWAIQTDLVRAFTWKMLSRVMRGEQCKLNGYESRTKEDRKQVFPTLEKGERMKTSFVTSKYLQNGG